MALWRIRATVDDRPGFLAVLAASLALRQVNILSVQVHATEGGAVDEFLVDAPDALSEEDLRAAVAKGRGRDAWVRPADAYGLVDVPTRLITLATRLVRDSDDLGPALRDLLGDVMVSWRPRPSPSAFTEGLMTLPDPDGGSLEVRRLDPPFTPAEYARAMALVDLAGTVARQARGADQLMLPDGTELTVRPAGRTDLAALPAVRQWCPSSASTALVAVAAEGIVGLAHLGWHGTDAELGLYVVDAWRRRGVGTALARRAVRLAARSGREAVHVHPPTDDAPVVRTVRRLGLLLRCETDGPMCTVTVSVPAGRLTGRLEGEHRYGTMER